MSFLEQLRDRATARRIDARDKVCALLEQGTAMPAWDIKQSTNLRMIRVYQALDDLLWDGRIVDQWVKDPQYPDRLPRRFYRWVS